MGDEYKKYLEENYDEGSEIKQKIFDIPKAKWINFEAKNFCDVKIKELNDSLSEEGVSKEDDDALQELYDQYVSNEGEYLVDGATLICNMASIEMQTINGEDFGTELISGEEGSRETKLLVPENASKINGKSVATVKNHKVEDNVVPFVCNCIIRPDREAEIESIFEDLENCKKYGTCQKLIRLEDDWDNFVRSTEYLTYDYSEDGEEVTQVQGITMKSMLFCSHGGLITPVRSGQIYMNVRNKEKGEMIGYLAYGGQSITQNPDEGYFQLYDGPTVIGIGEAYGFADIYKYCDKEPFGALQGFGGTKSILNTSGNLTTYGGQKLDVTKGTLLYNGIERHTIALGPKLQNIHFDTDTKKEIDPKEMAYGTCVDVTIELDGEIYYIPAIITDVKAHTASNGYYQTNETFTGEKEGDSKPGNIVEWYVMKGEDSQNKSTGLKVYNENGGIIIYRDEVME